MLSPRYNSWEWKAAGLLSGAMLLAWVVILAIDINHPPGVRTARMAAALLALGLGALEFLRPGAGLTAFVFSWPFMHLLRHGLMSSLNTQAWGGFPTTLGPAAAALGIAFWLRTNGRRDFQSPPAPAGMAFSDYVRVLLAAFVLIWCLSAVVSAAWLLGPFQHPGWHVDALDARRLSALSAFSPAAPLGSVLRVIPELLLGILLLNFYLGNSMRQWRDDPGALLSAARYSALPAAGFLIAEMLLKFSFPFDENPPSGLFTNRNTAAPVLIVLGLLYFFSARPEEKRSWHSFAGVGLIALACVILSRNGVFMVLGLFWLLLFARPTRTRLALGIALPLLAIAAVYFVPLPRSETLKSESLQRLVLGIEYVRAGDWANATNYRTDLYVAAVKTFTLYPVLGSGPSTFPMLVHPGAMFGIDITKNLAYMAAHSMPLNQLAETGLFGCLTWLALWIVLPFAAILRWGRNGIPALAACVFGIGNILDTSWLTPGITTLAVLLLLWMCCYEAADAPHTQP
ncbi:MAG TPA: O-antigen ligase family protein [Planctomycetota bacterium]|nr:O-antigen ligase family protein [Planctomycetota bacterium]